jgi:plastocyanin
VGGLSPALLALALGMCAVGAATGPALLTLGVVASLAAAAGWFATSWREHPSWTAPVRERVRYRLLVPASMPVAMFGLVLVIAISVSRVLLAVPEKAAVVIALVLAIGLLFGLSLIASRPDIGRSALTALAVLAAVSLAGAGIAGAAKGERKVERIDTGPPPVRLLAHNIRFNLDRIVLRRGVSVVFHDKDTGIFHNFAIYEQRDDGTQGQPVFNGQPINHGKIVYRPPLPPAGSYVFVCDFHANMKGTLEVPR